MKRLAILAAGLLLVVGLVGTCLWSRPKRPPLPTLPPGPLREVQPKATVVVPTLDTPIPEGKSALWCASFQMAWERLQKDVTKGPVRLAGGEEVARRLNDAPSVLDTVNEEDVYAVGGFVRDGIVARIKREMEGRFPGVAVGELPEFPNGAVAYAYLQAAVKFTHPFLENERTLSFVAPDGSEKAVKSFGLPEEINRPKAAEEQVEILHATRNKLYRIETFVLDLSKRTSPYQVLVAKLPRQPTLGATLADVEKRIATPSDKELVQPIRFLDSVAIPHLRFRLTHRFKELEGKAMPDQGMVLERAIQRIDFRLDTTGAQVSSESVIMPKSDPRSFNADRPFLVLLRKRGSTQPFFVLWVDNAELLEPAG